MKQMQLYVDGEVTTCNVLITETFLERGRGLLFRDPIKLEEGLFIRPCNSIHTAGLKYKLDVVFVASSGSVVKVVSGISPWSVSGSSFSDGVLELCFGGVERFGIEEGSQIEFREMLRSIE
jgi:uncharacterized protein